MTIILLPSRALSLRTLSRLSASQTVLNSLRVGRERHAFSTSPAPSDNAEPSSSSLEQARDYATASAATRQPGKPKAHTGRATASTRQIPKATTTTKLNATQKPAPKKGAAKRTARPKAKPKVKTAPRRRRVLTDKQKAARDKKNSAGKLKELKARALLTLPKRLPGTAYLVLSSEENGSNVVDRVRAASAKYKNLSPEEHERINHVANENKAKNEAAYKNWLSQFTPLQVRDANHARNQLRQQAKAAGQKKYYAHIHDDRLVKQPVHAYSHFLADRIKSGDFKDMKIPEVGPLIAREWKALTAGDKQKYHDLQAKELARYVAECKTVYGLDVPLSKPTTS